jgi:transposase
MAALKAGATQAKVAEQFGIAKSTLEKWWYRQRDSGSCAAKPHRSGPPRRLAGCERFIRAEIKKQADVTLAELCARVQKKRGVRASRSAMGRTVQLLRLPRKKSLCMTASARRRA